ELEGLQGIKAGVHHQDDAAAAAPVAAVGTTAGHVLFPAEGNAAVAAAPPLDEDPGPVHEARHGPSPGTSTAGPSRRTVPAVGTPAGHVLCPAEGAGAVAAAPPLDAAPGLVDEARHGHSPGSSTAGRSSGPVTGGRPAAGASSVTPSRVQRTMSRRSSGRTPAPESADCSRAQPWTTASQAAATAAAVTGPGIIPSTDRSTSMPCSSASRARPRIRPASGA